MATLRSPDGRPPRERPTRAEAIVDLAAIRHNVATLRGYAEGAQLMTVVKADGYGHGIVPVAQAARAAGADWIGAAVLEEALDLRDAGDTGPIFCWLTTPGEPLAEAIAEGIDLSAGAPWEIDELAAGVVDRPARVHLKIDTGMSRGGAVPEEWPALIRAALREQAAGRIEIKGIWSHLANSDEPKSEVNDSQLATFTHAIEVAESFGVEAEFKHLANSGATLALPETHFNLVRPGVATYGLSPFGHSKPAAELGLRPAMTLKARLAMVKRVPAGVGVSYGLTWTAPRPSNLGLIPLGYGDGLPRHASNGAPVQFHDARRSIVGRICMDQCVVNLEDDDVAPGDEVVLFGPGASGEPSVDDWADAARTINYEIVTRLGPRIPRRYVDTAPMTGPASGPGER
ncbi:alanine racemase [Kribbella sandramycini]|uniref:Alanine racemase n=1 Tax=Kribbella sandramycini TaxID=60450 RepID=A0A7Y4L0V7_9ACTN|nr:alanine racemase [Kribbella sandramycini]MBB6564576.1 alanine racemase [Kribbella sandramycini]NOL42280.1 alanine racemase [Kribbella sandramycini]